MTRRSGVVSRHRSSEDVIGRHKVGFLDISFGLYLCLRNVFFLPKVPHRVSHKRIEPNLLHTNHIQPHFSSVEY
jgi:hypothetical protein